ncbi:uncharacterized protein [Panulirus ornatus]|uniref:uncharacterized protein isoform X2 n=1 Tax=Panulirus ornatus TaxID=150431 RepID=UPI003A86815C
MPPQRHRRRTLPPTCLYPPPSSSSSLCWAVALRACPFSLPSSSCRPPDSVLVAGGDVVLLACSGNTTRERRPREDTPRAVVLSGVRTEMYRLQRGLSTPVMPLEALRRKVKEARRRLLPHTHAPPASASSSPNPKQKQDKEVPPDSPSSRLSSPSVVQGWESPGRKHQQQAGTRPAGCSSLQQYWTGEGGGDEEIELLQQYLNLQQLAVSRKHSTQLRRIRDSLIARVRSRPSSMVKVRSSPPKVSAHTPTKDRQELRNFLLDIGFVQYYSLLNRHGYDLATAAHMDALDLAGVGITEPLHRMAIKFELDLVRKPPPAPEQIPETIEEWLESLALQDYVENFHQNGIYCPLAALGLTKRDLQLMGIYMLGHRKKILLAILGLKEALYRKEQE